MPPKVYIISDTNLNDEEQRIFARLREQWRMDHPRWKWKTVPQCDEIRHELGRFSVETHVSANVENSGKSGKGKKVY